MDIRTELRALRTDDGPQRVAQAAMQDRLADWQAREAAVLTAFERFANGAPLAECPALATLFAPGDGARRLAMNFVAMMADGLGAQPLGHVPLRHSCNRAVTTLVLARSGQVTLSLVAFDGAGVAMLPPARTADFGPSTIHEHVLAGEAMAERIVCRPRPGGADLDRAPVRLAAGDAFFRDGERETLHITAAPRALLSLRLQRRAVQGVTREYDLSDGRLVHQAAGNPRESRIELMLSLLGRMGRVDAAPIAASIACGTGGDGLRWQALRECLALDTATGFAALCDIAARPADPLSAAAGALRAQLVDAHPQLEVLMPCPA